MADQKLVDAFHEAALFLKDRIEHGGWKVFSSNYLREHVRCRFGFKVGNTLSPTILRDGGGKKDIALAALTDKTVRKAIGR